MNSMKLPSLITSGYVLVVKGSSVCSTFATLAGGSPLVCSFLIPSGGS